jgi:TetR/AcrR family transcriptional regulator
MGTVSGSVSPGDNRRGRERARREEDVLAAAERVFARRGYHAASMADVAREADYAVGSLYKFFESKEALFQQLLSVRLAALEQILDAALASTSSVHGQLEAIALAKARHAVRDRAFLSIFCSSIPGAYETLGLELPLVREFIARREAAVLAVIERGVKRGELTRTLPPRVILLAYTATVRAYTLQLVARPDGELDEDEVRALVRALLTGLASAKAPARSTAP